jgi:inner membrane transporter RhtA
MTRGPGSGAVPPWLLALAAMFSVQLGAALSVSLIDVVGPAGTSWLRLTMGACIFVAIARPPLRQVRRQDVAVIVALGVATGLVTTAFLAAIARIPLGTAVAIEFLGPLTLATVRAPNRRLLVWPALALVGVVLMTRPWVGETNAAGIGFAALSAVGWATYIALTQQVGDRFSGISGLSMTIPIAALTAAVVGVPQAIGHLDLGVVAAALGLALLMPVLPFALELLALRHMTSTAFGTLMALEPAFGLVMGVLLLHQVPAPVQVAGLALVVVAGAAAQRGGRRGPGPDHRHPHSELDLLG